jgi:hypothetical protein
MASTQSTELDLSKCFKGELQLVYVVDLLALHTNIWR